MAATKTFSAVQHKAIDDGFLDLLGEDQSNFKSISFDDTVNTLIQLAAQYVAKLTQLINERDVASSGKMADLIEPTSVQINGTTYTIGILAPEYASYQDEGVDGWDKSRGSRFKFKTKGVDPKGGMVKSVRDWLKREGKSARNVKVGISERERKGIGRRQKSRIKLDARTKEAVAASYMIKRMGIKPTHFWRDATEQMQVTIASELGAAVKIDIVNFLLS